MWYDTIDWWSAIRYHGATAQRTNKNLQELVISCAARQKRRFVRLFLLFMHNDLYIANLDKTQALII